MPLGWIVLTGLATDNEAYVFTVMAYDPSTQTLSGKYSWSVADSGTLGDSGTFTMTWSGSSDASTD